MRQLLALACLIVLWGDLAFAGLFELSATGSYRKTYFDSTHSTATQTLTAGLGYYFWELSALEFSYTQGVANQIQPEYTAYQTFQAYGLDLLITIANRDSALKPYLKVGAAYVNKSLRYYDPLAGSTRPLTTQGIAPTGGLGFKLMIGPQFAIKLGVDVSSSPLPGDANNPVTYDFAANGGISFLF